MKKIYLLLALLLSVSMAAFAFVEWNHYAIDERVSARFPAMPQEVDVAKLMASQGQPLPEGFQSRMLVTKDETGMYQLMRFTNPAFKAFTQQNRAAYFDGIAAGMVKNNGVIKERTPISTPAGDGYEFLVRSIQPQTGKPFTMYTRMLLLQGVGYMITFVGADLADSTGIGSSAQRQQFFNSLAVKKAVLHEH